VERRSLISSALYFVSSIFSADIKHEDLLPSNGIAFELQLQNLLQRQLVICNGIGNPLLDAAYSEMISSRDESGIKCLLCDLFAPANHSSRFDHKLVSSSLYCFNIMMRVVKGKAQRSVLASNAVRALRLMNQVIHPPYKSAETFSTWIASTKVTLSCLAMFIRKNDLFNLKASHIATILAAIVTIFQGNETEDMDYKSAVNEDVFVSICGVLIGLLRQYTKQLYGCIPSLTLTLRYLFKHLISYKRQSEKDTFDCCRQMIQEFTKVCECLPENKDVFKKHIMFLIIDWVDVLTFGNIESWRKLNLEPTVFLLLETLSVYENQQLNAMIQPNGKPFLQSVFKSFQKHQYKGQF